jgi:transposase InsO family protein
MSTPRAAYSVSAKEGEMRFDEAMVQQRGAIVRLVQERILTQGQAAAELGLSERQVRRLVQRVVDADGAVSSLAYDRTHAAPNRLAEPVRTAVQELVRAQPQASAQAVWEALEARGAGLLPSLRTVSRWQQAERPARVVAQPRPARRFEAARPLQLVQMDTTSGEWVSGKQMAYVIALLDDYSRAILAARAVAADSTANNLAVLEAAVERYGPMQVLYSDNGSVFRVTRHGRSRFQAYRPEVLAGEVPTQLARALQELGAVPLTHELGNARAKGKLERWNRFMQERLVRAGPFPSIPALDAALQDWLHYYNERHQHRALGGVPAARLVGYEPRALPVGARPLADICALLETRKVTKDHAVALAGIRYQLPREPNLVAFTVELRIRPGQTVRVWHDDRLIVELPHGGAPEPDGLSVAQVLEQILPRLDPKQPQAAARLPRRQTEAGA